MTNYQYQSCLESLCMDKLHCSLKDLESLEIVYSNLADSCNVDYKVVGELGTLKSILQYTMKVIRECVADYIELHAKHPYIEVTDKEGTGYYKYTVTEHVAEQIREVAKQIREAKPILEETELNLAKFNSLLDEAIEVFENLQQGYDVVAEDVIQLACDEDIIQVTEEYKEDL